MVVSLRGTSGGSIDDLCVVFFHNVYNLCVTRNIIRKGVQVKKIGDQIEVKGGAGRRKWSAPCWAGPGKSPGTGTLEKIHIHSLL